MHILFILGAFLLVCSVGFYAVSMALPWWSYQVQINVVVGTAFDRISTTNSTGLALSLRGAQRTTTPFAGMTVPENEIGNFIYYNTMSGPTLLALMNAVYACVIGAICLSGMGLLFLALVQYVEVVIGKDHKDNGKPKHMAEVVYEAGLVWFLVIVGGSGQRLRKPAVVWAFLSMVTGLAAIICLVNLPKIFIKDAPWCYEGPCDKFYSGSVIERIPVTVHLNNTDFEGTKMTTHGPVMGWFICVGGICSSLLASLVLAIWVARHEPQIGGGAGIGGLEATIQTVAKNAGMIIIPEGKSLDDSGLGDDIPEIL